LKTPALRLASILALLHALAALADVTCAQKEIPPQSGPVALNDVAFAVSGGVTVPVLANDQYAGTPSVVGLTPCSQQNCTTITTANGGTATIQSNAVVVYTPPAVPTGDSFQYTMTDSSQPGASATAEVSLLLAGQVNLTANCTGGSCAFTALPAVTADIRRYVWNWGDGSAPHVWPQQITHIYEPNCSPYPCSRTYNASVTVEYWSGSSVAAQRSVTVNFNPSPSWIVTTNGLKAGIEYIDTHGTLPLWTKVYATLSPNAADCQNSGCGPLQEIPACCDFNMKINDVYVRSGTYRATLRFDPSPAPPQPPVTPVDYTIFITVQNKPPVPAITAQRYDPRKRSFDFLGYFSDADDDGPLPYAPYEWDFGDGATYVAPVNSHNATHLFTNAGTYNVSLKMRDGEGLSAIATKQVQVVNTEPIAGITVNCALSDCTFSADATLDDGGPFQSVFWTFDDGAASKEERPAKHYDDAGCHNVALQLTDAEGLTGSAQQRFVAGPPLTPQAGGIVSDAHVQSYQYVNQWYTSDGDLNGFLEPGETAVIEPRWPFAVEPLELIFVNSIGWTSTDWSYARPEFRATASSYSSASGFSDCWSRGRCYVVKIITGPRGPYAPDHNDVSFEERAVSSGLPTPASPVTIHVGKSFNDVPKTHWAYPFVESLLHLGIVAGCGIGEHNYCPATQLTRADIASWLLKAKYGAAWQPPSCVEPGPFNDVPCSHPAAAWIQQLKNEQLTAGTGGGNYSPSAILSRAELAIFALRTKLGSAYTPPACTADFADVQCPGHWAANWISDAKARGISNGCSAWEFCPSSPVDRAQAAAMLARAFNLRIDVNACLTASPVYDVVPGYVSQPPISAMTFDPPYVLVGGQSTGTITLPWAPGGKTSIPLSVDNPGALSVPANVAVDSGQTAGMFNVMAGKALNPATVQVSATYFGYTKTVPLAICTQPAPAITAQPQSRAINAGESATLTVAATGAVSYQWYRGTAPSTADPIPGATGPSVTVAPANTTSYWVAVTNACRTTPSATATITVCYPLAITKHPQSDIVVPNGTLTLSVETSGSGPLSYQWYEGPSGTTTTPIAGATSSTYTTPPLTATKSYWVRVTSTCLATVSRNSAAAEVRVITKMTRRQEAIVPVLSQSSITATWPRPTRAGTLLVAIITQATDSYIADYTVPAGWVPASTSMGGQIMTSIYYLPNNAGGRSTETFSTLAQSPQSPPPPRDLVLYLAEYVGGMGTGALDKTGSARGEAPDEDNLASSGFTTGNISQSNEVVITSVAIKATTELSGAEVYGFVETAQASVESGGQLTMAAHEAVVNYQAQYGHYVIVGNGKEVPHTEWVGALATFRSAIAHTSGSEGGK
jgi:hypothetical protein